MRAFVNRAGFTLALLVGAAGCQSPPAGARTTFSTAPALAPAAVAVASLSPNLVEEGRNLYLAKCARCHKFYDPAAYGTTAWETWMKKMSKKARLTTDQEQLLSRYLGAFRGTAERPRP